MSLPRTNGEFRHQSGPCGIDLALFGTGVPSLSGLADGAIASGAAPYSQELNQFQIMDQAGAEASIMYIGAAPGLIDGVFQLNVQLPTGESTTNPTLTLKSGWGSTLLSIPPSNPVQIYSQ